MAANSERSKSLLFGSHLGPHIQLETQTLHSAEIYDWTADLQAVFAGWEIVW
jgi:hypothetical protein